MSCYGTVISELAELLALVWVCASSVRASMHTVIGARDSMRTVRPGSVLFSIWSECTRHRCARQHAQRQHAHRHTSWFMVRRCVTVYCLFTILLCLLKFHALFAEFRFFSSFSVQMYLSYPTVWLLLYYYIPSCTNGKPFSSLIPRRTFNNSQICTDIVSKDSIKK